AESKVDEWEEEAQADDANMVEEDEDDRIQAAEYTYVDPKLAEFP
ncbi:hypothetical protein A2U01_0049081, partial [Trifolium medium]|nr:hypothetical protein [Trifolium medium]